MTTTISIDIHDVAEAGSIEAALLRYCDASATVAAGVIGPSFATSGPGAGWSREFGPTDYAERALSDDYGATAYLDVRDGRLATGGYDEAVEWSDESVVELIVPRILDALDEPDAAREMAKAALDTHSAESDTEGWQRILRVLDGDYSDVHLKVSISKSEDGRWVWCGNGWLDNGHITDCDADLGDDIYAALDDEIEPRPGEYTVEVDGDEYSATVEIDE